MKPCEPTPFKGQHNFLKVYTSRCTPHIHGRLAQTLCQATRNPTCSSRISSSTKKKQKLYKRHSGRPGGLKSESLEKLRDRKPERILECSIKGMLPKGPLGRQMYTKLKVYAGDTHPHQAQTPELLNL